MPQVSYAKQYAARGGCRRRQKQRIRWPAALLLAAALLLGICLYGRAGGLPFGTPRALRELAERNPEAREFAAHYLDYHDTSRPIDLRGDVTPGQTPLFLQWDARWGYAPYGGTAVEDMIGLSGCGPTALSMVTVALTDNLDWDPRAVADFAAENGYCVDGAGTAWSLMCDGCAALGLSSRELSPDENAMIAALDAGELLIASVGPGDFTQKGHFIVICGYDGAAFEIRDPNSRKNSEASWRYDTLAPQITALWALAKA